MYKRIEFFELANRNKNYDENSNGEGHLCLLYLVFISAFFLFLRKHPLQTATATPATVGKKKKNFPNNHGTRKMYSLPCILWQYGWSTFQERDTKLDRFLVKNQHTVATN